MLEQSELFISGEGGCHTYRIPALVTTTTGRVLALCEGRRASRGDSGQIDLLLRHSDDEGRTWSSVRVVVSESEMTCGNPCPVVDRQTGRILLTFCKNLADGPESMICEGKAPRTVWLTYSDDDGETWVTPREITDQAKHPSWTWYATGPCHGIQLSTGRLVIPCDHMIGVYHDRQRDPYHSHVILSDDGGETWRVGGIVEEGTNECAVAETTDGSLYINCRNYRGEKRRAAARSQDGGESFGPRAWVDDHPEPICQAAMATLSATGAASDRVLFANPADRDTRSRLTVRLSEDGGRSWPVLRCLYEGPAAYSDLAVVDGGHVLCLYERGAENAYETLTLARFDEAWLNGE
ncbi:MAG: exo-alpha-sialidase [Gemmatimonadetes bacterium]|jgi:sialidase-1|nr:exo-alpha-sialidase [Gemmatimonadota bacterium]MBT6144495.1 exo-alpha-sialidase [Gemmatimonadota bacterium]MBT7862017.1 exo-alpha-sialidase [Gemmatimonadota bacterium]